MDHSRQAELFRILEDKLYTAVVSDVLDSLGYRDQVMAAELNPLLPGSVIAGRARTILAVDYYEHLTEPYGKEIELVDSLVPGDVVIGATNESVRNGLWGELMSTASHYRGARGAVIDGYVRDLRKIRTLGFPIWCTGAKPVDSAGRGYSIACDVTVRCGGVIVHPGDTVFADEDGVVVIPQDLLEEVVRIAFEKISAEDATREDLSAGVSLAEVFRKRGVL